MRRIEALALILLFASPAFAARITGGGSTSSGSGGGGSSTLAVADDGVIISSPTAAIDVVGNGLQVLLSGSTTAQLLLTGDSTHYIRNTTTLQIATFTVQSGSVFGPFVVHSTDVINAGGSRLFFDPSNSSPQLRLSQNSGGSPSGAIYFNTNNSTTAAFGTTSTGFFLQMATSASSGYAVDRISFLGNASQVTFHPNNEGFTQANSSISFVQDGTTADPQLTWGNDGELRISTGMFAISGLNCTGNSNGGAVTTNSSGQLICSDDDSGSGGGGSSSLAVTTGATAGFTHPPVSSPTAVIVFSSDTFNVALTGSATAFVTLKASSVTLAGVLRAGTNITLTPSDGGTTIDASSSGGGDNLGSHIATKTIVMNGFSITNIGASSTSFNSNGDLDVATATIYRGLRIPFSSTHTTTSAGFVAVDTNAFSSSMGTMIYHDGNQQYYVIATTDTPSDNEIPRYDAGSGVMRFELIGSIASTGTYTAILNAEQAKLPNSNPCVISNGTNAVTSMLLCDASTDESVTFPTLLKPYNGGILTATIYFSMASATSGNVVTDVSLMCVTPGDSADIDTESFSPTNTSTTSVPGTAGHVKTATTTITHTDSCAEGDIMIVKFNRDANNAVDTATGDLEVRKIVISEPPTADDGGSRLLATFTIYDDGAWDSEAVPIWIAPDDTSVTITGVHAAVMGSSTPSLTYNIEERAKGSLGSAGTDVYSSDQAADATGEDESSFANASIAAGAHLVLTTGASSESGTVDLITGVVYYERD